MCMSVLRMAEKNIKMSTSGVNRREHADSSEIKDASIERNEATNFECKFLLYGVNDIPPFHITVVCGLQQGLMSLSAQLVVSLLVAEAVCASDNDMFKSRLLSSTLLMSGITTVAMNVIGIRLPFFQGAASEYVVPLLLVANVDGTFCSSLRPEPVQVTNVNLTANGTASSEVSMDRILFNVRALQGSLMVAGVIHALVGMTGMIGLLVRFIGPLTIVPTMILIWIFIVRSIMKFVEPSWGIACSTIVVAVILFLYLGKYNMPVPVWTPKGGFRIIRYPLHQVFAILISILLNWLLCGILTVSGVLTDDKNDIAYRTRTDAAGDLVATKPWFSLPYPGQFGPFGFSGPAMISCLIATFMSILDSIGDYYACARVCRVPTPPSHAVNRGIMIEGVCSLLSGAVGCGHATSTYGGNIGAIGVTKVASRWVFICTGIIYIIFGIFGKISAIFITIPYPVLGGAIVVLYGIFFGVVVSNLEVTAMSSPRNMAILGLSTFIGLLVPTWVEKVKNPIDTGLEEFDRIVAMLIGNPNLVGTILACFLDNTVPGTREERGIAAWQQGDNEAAVLDRRYYNEGYEVYLPLLPKSLLDHKIMKYIPFLPYTGSKKGQPSKDPETDEKVECHV